MHTSSLFDQKADATSKSTTNFKNKVDGAGSKGGNGGITKENIASLITCTYYGNCVNSRASGKGGSRNIRVFGGGSSESCPEVYNLVK